MHRIAVALTFALGVAGTLVPGTGTVAAAGAAPQSVVVVFSDAVADPASLAADLGLQHGFSPRHVYTIALRGFVATLPVHAIAAMRRNPSVVAVEPEAVQQIADTLPTGIDRIDADRLLPGLTTSNGVTVDADVAIIDTGIYRHAELNVAGGYNATSRNRDNWSDGNGHGTHVAGTVAALDNGSGVVGVAPGARVWAVRVCKTGRTCLTGDMVAGIDWIAQRKAEFNDGSGDGDAGVNFAVANMSLTSSDDAIPCPTADAVHRAVCGLVATGVVFVQAAANENRVKNAYPEVMSVSALADFDGKPGGLGAATCRSDVDDTRADFSNYGPTTDIAAPGVCIRSTWNDGGYAVLSGTSMAAPHVAGAVALYLHQNRFVPASNASGVDNIETAIIGSALTQGDPCGYYNDKAGVGSTERLLFVNGPAFGGNGSCGPA